jgi:hypothetical protein
MEILAVPITPAEQLRNLRSSFIIKLNKKRYMLSDDIIKNAPIFCKGIRNGNDLYKKMNIDKANYIFVRKTADGWIEIDRIYDKFDKVLIRYVYLKKQKNYIYEINGIITS